MKERELAEHQVNQLQQEASGWERTKMEMSEELKELKTALAKKEQVGNSPFNYFRFILSLSCTGNSYCASQFNVVFL